MSTEAKIRVYANGRRFVVVPVISTPLPSSDSNPEAVEITPAHSIPLTLGRPTVVRLARALRAAKQASQAAEDDAPRWDGEGGRWWAHHLLGLALTWRETEIALAEIRGRDSARDLAHDLAPLTLPAETPESALAEKLIELLGQKLHAA